MATKCPDSHWNCPGLSVETRSKAVSSCLLFPSKLKQCLHPLFSDCGQLLGGNSIPNFLSFLSWLKKRQTMTINRLPKLFGIFVLFLLKILFFATKYWILAFDKKQRKGNNDFYVNISFTAVKNLPEIFGYPLAVQIVLDDRVIASACCLCTRRANVFTMNVHNTVTAKYRDILKKMLLSFRTLAALLYD